MLLLLLFICLVNWLVFCALYVYHVILISCHFDPPPPPTRSFDLEEGCRVTPLIMSLVTRKRDIGHVFFFVYAYLLGP